MLYTTEYGDTLCEDCAREYYHDDLPGAVKHGPEELFAQWLRRHATPVDSGECDWCGAETTPPLPTAREAFRILYHDWRTLRRQAQEPDPDHYATLMLLDDARARLQRLIIYRQEPEAMHAYLCALFAPRALRWRYRWPGMRRPGMVEFMHHATEDEARAAMTSIYPHLEDAAFWPVPFGRSYRDERVIHTL